MNNKPSYFFIRTDKKYIRIDYCDLLYTESVGNYVRLVTTQNKYLSPVTVHYLSQFLPVDKFTRVNRSTIISLDRINWFTKTEVNIASCEVCDTKDRTFHLSARHIYELEKRVTILAEPRVNKKTALPGKQERVAAS